MNSKRIQHGFILLILMAMVLTACAQATPTSAPVAVEPTAVPTEAAPTAETPKVLSVAAILSSTADNPWDKSFLLSFERVRQAAPHGLTINALDYSEGVWGDEAEVVLREYAVTGKYDIIWANSAYSDQVKKLKDEFPDILWVVTGSGNEGMGGNAYFLFLHLHEVAYLMGRLAGAMTKTNVIGNVAGFPTDDTYDVINGFIAGAKAVNPKIEAKVTFIESWYDPAKAADAAVAQIAAGADQIYMNSYGFEPCVDAKVFCYATYEDLNNLAPSAVLTSAIAYWDPHINYIIDEWWNHKTLGTAYNASVKDVWFTMAQGTGDIAPFHELDSLVPQAVKDDVAQTKADILSGKLVVPLDLTPYAP